PSFEGAVVWELLEQTRQTMDFIARQSAPPLGALRDPRQALNRASKGGVLTGAETFQAGDSLYAMRNLKETIRPKRAEYPVIWRFVEFLPEHKRLEDQIFDSLDSDGAVKDGASPQLGTLRQKKKSASSRIQDRIQSY